MVYGVEAMHRMGLLHRGISPETVFITKTGSAKLSGYATLGLRTADSELKSQMFDGYAAPEQYAVAEFDGNTPISMAWARCFTACSRQDARAGKPAPDERYPAARPYGG